ncbi:MAG TPA: STAS domain-containing protein [Actinomycetota bacterium]|nr:STAS domain-containing protein [Actinomycetota bacterium]
MGTHQSFTARVESRNGVTIIAMGGELDMASVPTLREHLTQVEGDSPGVILADLRDLSFIDSSGLGALLEANKRSELNWHRFFTVGASPTARRLFQITGTEHLLDDNDAVRFLDRFTRGQDRAGTVRVDADA